jgi:hypothetical protein
MDGCQALYAGNNMNELDAAIYTRLQGTAITSQLAGTTSLYHIQAPENATLPYIVWNIQGGGDENLTQNRTKNLVMFIRAYSANTAAQAGSIDDQVDAALTNSNVLTVSGWTNIWLAREQDVETVQLEPSGKQIFMAGGLYRVWLDKT